MKCLAAQETPFPEKCIEWYCAFPMRDKQMQWIEHYFDGDITPEEDDLPSTYEYASEYGDLWIPGRD